MGKRRYSNYSPLQMAFGKDTKECQFTGSLWFCAASGAVDLGAGFWQFPWAGLNLYEHLSTWIKGINWKIKSIAQDCRQEKPKLLQWEGGKGGFCLPPLAGGAGNRKFIQILFHFPKAMHELRGSDCRISQSHYFFIISQVFQMNWMFSWSGWDLQPFFLSSRTTQCSIIPDFPAADTENITNYIPHVNYFKQGLINRGDFAHLALGTHHCPAWGNTHSTREI